MPLAKLRERRLQSLEERGIVELAGDVIEPVLDALPLVGLERLALGLANLLAHLLAVGRLIDLRARHAEDGELLRQVAALHEIEDGRQQLAAREISGRAEDHEDA